MRSASTRLPHCDRRRNSGPSVTAARSSQAWPGAAAVAQAPPCCRPGTGEIAAHVLTEGHADDTAQVPALLGQTEGVIASVTADGAYDGEPIFAAAAARQRHPTMEVVVRPRASTVPSSDNNDGGAPSQRDHRIQLMAERGRMGWQRATGYGRRNQAETAMFRYKHLVGPKLCTRSLPAQRGEAAIAVAALNNGEVGPKPDQRRPPSPSPGPGLQP